MWAQPSLAATPCGPTGQEPEERERDQETDAEEDGKGQQLDVCRAQQVLPKEDDEGPGKILERPHQHPLVPSPVPRVEPILGPRACRHAEDTVVVAFLEEVLGERVFLV